MPYYIITNSLQTYFSQLFIYLFVFVHQSFHATSKFNHHHFPLSPTDVQSPPTVLCDYCGQLFDTRKALSCHARAHLRQLGLAWTIKTSPIDLLKEVMMHGMEGRGPSAPSGSAGKATWAPQGPRRSLDSLQSGEPATKPCTSPLDYSMKEKSPSGKSGASQTGDIAVK